MMRGRPRSHAINVRNDLKNQQHACADRIGFDLGVRNDPHLLRVRDYDPLHVRPDHGGNCGCIAGCLDDDNVILRQPLRISPTDRVA